MKTKVTVWTLASDDDNGTQAAVFATEKESLEEYARKVLEGEENRKRAADLIQLHLSGRGQEDQDIYEFLYGYHGPLDTYSIEPHEVEIDVPESPGTARIRKALEDLLAELDKSQLIGDVIGKAYSALNQAAEESNAQPKWANGCPHCSNNHDPAIQCRYAPIPE